MAGAAATDTAPFTGTAPATGTMPVTDDARPRQRHAPRPARGRRCRRARAGAAGGGSAGRPAAGAAARPGRPGPCRRGARGADRQRHPRPAHLPGTRDHARQRRRGRRAGHRRHDGVAAAGGQRPHRRARRRPGRDDPGRLGLRRPHHFGLRDQRRGGRGRPLFHRRHRAGRPARRRHRADRRPPPPRRLAACRGRTAKTGALARLREAARAAPGLLSPQDVVTTVRPHTPPETIATVDAGAHMLVAMPLWEVDEPHRLLISSGLATMGYALPAAIAAALCTPARRSSPSPATAAWA